MTAYSVSFECSYYLGYRFKLATVHQCVRLYYMLHIWMYKSIGNAFAGRKLLKSVYYKILLGFQSTSLSDFATGSEGCRIVHDWYGSTDVMGKVVHCFPFRFDADFTSFSYQFQNRRNLPKIILLRHSVFYSTLCNTVPVTYLSERFL